MNYIGFRDLIFVLMDSQFAGTCAKVGIIGFTDIEIFVKYRPILRVHNVR